MRRPLLLALIAALLALAGGAAYALPRWLDWERHRDALAQIASERLGRPVALEGRVALVLLPQPQLEASRIVIGEAADDIRMSARALRLRLDLWSLLRGRIDVRELALVGADIRLPWPPTSLPGLAPPPWLTALDARIEESRIAIGGAVVEGVSARLTAGGISEALTAEGSLAWRGRQVRFQAVLGRAGDDGIAPLDFTATHAGANVQARGVLLADGGFEGRLQAVGPDLSVLIPAPPGAFQATADLAAGAEMLVASNLALLLGEQDVRGSAALWLTPSPRFDLALVAPRLDLEAWLAALRGAGTQAVPASLDLSAEVASFGPLRLTRVKAVAALQGERLTLNEFSAEAPGGTLLEISGAGSAPRLDLAASWRSAVPGALAENLGWPARFALPPGPSEGRLRLSWEGSQFAVTELSARLGPSRVTGGFVWRHGARPSLALGIDVDAFETAMTGADILALLRERSGDTDLQLRLGFARLVVAGDVWERLAIDGAAEGGRMILRRLAGRHLGLDLAVTGTLAGTRVSDLTLEAEGAAGPLLGALGVERPALAASPLRLRASGGGPLEALALRLEADLAEARLEAQATLDQPQERLQATVTLRHPGATRLLTSLLQGETPSWIGDGSFSLIANVAGRSGAWTADSVELVAGGLRGRGQLAHTIANGRAALSGRVHLERLPFPDLRDLGARAWPSFDLDLALRADRVEAVGQPTVEQVSAVLKADGQALRLDEIRGSVAGGTLHGKVRLERAAGPRIVAQGGFADIVLAAPMTGRPIDIGAGRLSGEFNLTASGDTPDRMIATLGGTGRIALRDGIVQGFDAAAAAVALGWGDTDAAQAALVAAFSGGATPIERGSAALSLAEGRITLGEAMLGGEAGLVLGLSGWVDLPQDTLDLRLTLPVPDPAPDVALRLTGPTTAPARRADLAPWLRWRADHPP